MFGFLLRCVLIACGIYTNFDFVLIKSDIYKLYSVPGGKFRFFNYLCNYLAIFALCIGFIKKLKIASSMHSFFMTLALSAQFTSVTLYWSYKKANKIFTKPIKTGDERMDVFVETAQNLLLFIACLMDPFYIGSCKKFVRFCLFMLSLGYVGFVCYLHKVYSFWVYEFMINKDNVEICTFLGLIILLPQVFYKFLLVFMPSKYDRRT